MADKATPPKDLTSTLNLRQLRSIPQAGLSEDLLKSLTIEQKNVFSNGIKRIPYSNLQMQMVIKVFKLYRIDSV